MTIFFHFNNLQIRDHENLGPQISWTVDENENCFLGFQYVQKDLGWLHFWLMRRYKRKMCTNNLRWFQDASFIALSLKHVPQYPLSFANVFIKWNTSSKCHELVQFHCCHELVQQMFISWWLDSYLLLWRTPKCNRPQVLSYKRSFQQVQVQIKLHKALGNNT